MSRRRRKRDRFGWTLLVALIGLVGMAIAASSCAGAQVFGSCIKAAAPQDAQAIVSEVVAIASSPAGWIDALVKLGEEIGPGTVQCISQAIAADEKLKARQPQLVAHARSYIEHERAAGRLRPCP